MPKTRLKTKSSRQDIASSRRLLTLNQLSTVRCGLLPQVGLPGGEVLAVPLPGQGLEGEDGEVLHVGVPLAGEEIYQRTHRLWVLPELQRLDGGLAVRCVALGLQEAYQGGKPRNPQLPDGTHRGTPDLDRLVGQTAADGFQVFLHRALLAQELHRHRADPWLPVPERPMELRPGSRELLRQELVGLAEGGVVR